MMFSLIVGADGRKRAWLAGLVLALLVPASPAAAQNLSFASVNGTVTDETGAGLPGVTVSATSPALQDRQRTGVTDNEGFYRLADLPVGTYRVQYELAGFQPLIREGLQLSAGFAARLNVTLKLGQVQETVTVSGASPVVDVTSTRGGQTVPTELLTNQLPAQKLVGDLLQITAGLTPNVGQNPGVVGLSNRVRFITYGLQSSNTNINVMIDGFDIIVHTIPDVANALESDVKTFGNGAEVKEPGVALNFVTPSGGNDFHGRYSASFMHGSTESTNLDDKLRKRGLSVGETLRYFYDASGDLGGRLVRDKLWFYGSLRHRQNNRSITGLVLNAGPDGEYLTGDEPPAYPYGRSTHGSVKLSYQMRPGYQAISHILREYTTDDVYLNGPAGVPSTLIPPWESTLLFQWKTYHWRNEISGTPRSDLLFNAQFGKSTYLAPFLPRPGFETRTYRWDRRRNLYTGAAFPSDNHSIYWIAKGSVTYAPPKRFGGRHEFTLGFRSKFNDGAPGISQYNSAAGNYLLVYDTVGGIPNQPVEIQTNNAPFVGRQWDNSHSLYLTDQWRVGDRLTFNLGLRFDRQHSYVPEQVKEQGQFGVGGTFPRLEVGTWNYLAPRAAVSWDLTGSGKTVLKGTYGRFNLESSLSRTFNRNSLVTTSYRWRDLNGNNDYDPGEVNLDTNGPDFISLAGAQNLLMNPDLRLPYATEITGAIEHELAPNVAVRGLYLYRRMGDLYESINVLRPYSAFNIPLTRQDPGADGVLGTADDGGMFTIYDYDAAFRGSRFVGTQLVNRPSDRADSYQAIEGSLTKRSTGRWSILTSYTATKYHRWIVGIPQSPNDEYFPLDTKWRWNFKLSGSYTLPYDVLVGAMVDIVNGPLGQRVNIFRAADPRGGPPLRQLTTVTLRVEEFGSQAEPAVPVMNLRVGKKISLWRAPLQVSLDAVNVLNSNAIKVATFISGPTFGAVQDIVPPRNLRVGVSWEF